MAASHHLQLYYFPYRGRAEVLRLTMEIAGLRYATIVPEDWMAFRNTLPWGQLPLLVDGDLRLSQSKAILRHLGRVGDLYGSTPREASMIDMLLEGEQDWRNYYTSVVYSRGSFTDYPHDIEEYKNKYLLQQLEIFDNLLQRNSGGHGYLVGNRMSIADIAVYEILDIHTALAPTCLDTLPHLKAFRYAPRTVVALAAVLALTIIALALRRIHALQRM